MELSTLNKEYNLVRQENVEKFLKVNEIDANLAMVEEYWITSDHTMGNRCAYFDNYFKAVEYAKILASKREALNRNKEKPFVIFVNGKKIKANGLLRDFLDGKFTLTA
ncbi:MAG: hypothetical protein E7241_06225 [Lachnospiraceae bacterium]|nr:hypothetical protein [Lachnospiraceae bacterium]